MPIFLRALPVTLVLFVAPIVALFLLLCGMWLIDAYLAATNTQDISPLGPEWGGTSFFASQRMSREQDEAYFMIGSFVVGMIGALSAYQLQKVIAKDSISFVGHILVAWPIYLLIGWIILHWWVFPAPHRAPFFALYAFILPQCACVTAHLALMLDRHATTQTASTER